MTWAAYERTAYQAARSWGIQPSEFWRMSTWEWWMEFDAKVIEARRLEEISEEFKSGKGGKSNVFTKEEWARAREKHKAKMNERTSRP